MTIQVTVARRTNMKRRAVRPWSAWLAERPSMCAEGGTKETALHKLRTRIATNARLTKRFRATKPVIEELIV
jgi:hypothetical protein